jgi:hypothetical protein
MQIPPAVSKFSLTLCFLLLFLGIVSASAQTFSCPAGYTDVAQYMMGSYFVSNPNAATYMAADPDYVDTTGSGNTPAYPQWWPQPAGGQGKLWWSRSYNSSSYLGYNWDMSLFDDSYIYFGYTNAQPWGDNPNTYRQYYDPDNTTSGAHYWTVAPRCVLTSTSAGSLYSNGESVLPPSYGNSTQDTDTYNVNSSTCDPGPITPEAGVQGAVFELYAPDSKTSVLPYPLHLANNPNDNLMALVYRWDYNPTTYVYATRETFYFDSEYGWVVWTSENWSTTSQAYELTNFNYADTFSSIAQHVAPGQPTLLVGSSSCPTN